jgi:hypothetical protein
MRVRKSHRISVEEGKEARELMKTEKNASAYRRLQVTALLGEGRASAEVSQITGFCEKQVRVFGLRFHKEGAAFAAEKAAIIGT